jgi:hypothetical protein
MKWSLFFSSLSLLFIQPVLAQENWVVNPDQAACLIQNISEYQVSKDEPIVIFLDVCPTVDRMEALRKMQKNSSTLPGPRVYVLEDGSEKEADKVIVYSRDELECLRQLNVATSVAPVLLPQRPCGS